MSATTATISSAAAALFNEEDSTPATTQVTTVPAATVKPPFIQITVGTRKTKGGPEIKPENRSRSILVREWTPNVPSKFQALVNNALHETAKAQLAAMWKDNPAIKTVQVALFTEDSLLAYAAREAEGRRLNSDSIESWFLQSQLHNHLTTAANAKPAQIARFLAELKNLAAPVPDYNEEKALKRLSTLGMFDEDTEHEVCAQLITKLNSILEKIKAEREAIGSAEELDF